MDTKNLKITYIGGGSRAWARNLMNDLAKESELAGSVYLYDIDHESAKTNAIIGNTLSSREDVVGKWNYIVENDMDLALKDANFVVISILPGTFDEMESDVHTPEKYGIYQTVGDTTGPGGIIRALRTIPLFRKFADGIRRNCPNAWCINFTNPMTLCTASLYKEFPEIKAFGCCHEVFGTQAVFQRILKLNRNIDAKRHEIETNVLGVNHFTWVDKAYYKGENLFPLLEEYFESHPEGLIDDSNINWKKSPFGSTDLVKYDLYKRYGVLGAAGSRHLAEFCPSAWYLKNPQTAEKFGFNLTPVSWRRKDLEEKIAKTNKIVETGVFELYESGEESVDQIKALCGLKSYLTNVNLPNVGQMPDLPLGAVVETNAYFSSDSVRPVFAGKLPDNAHALVSRICREQLTVLEGAFNGDYELVFSAFVNDPNMPLDFENARKLFNEMLKNTKKYLPKEAYDKYFATQKA